MRAGSIFSAALIAVLGTSHAAFADSTWRVASGVTSAPGVPLMQSPGDQVCGITISDYQGLVGLGRLRVQEGEMEGCKIASFRAESSSVIVSLMCTIQASPQVSWAAGMSYSFAKTIKIRQIDDNHIQEIEESNHNGQLYKSISNLERCSGSAPASIGRSASLPDQSNQNQISASINPSTGINGQTADQLLAKRNTRIEKVVQGHEALSSIGIVGSLFAGGSLVADKTEWIAERLIDKVIDFGGLSVSSFGERVKNMVDNKNDIELNPKIGIDLKKDIDNALPGFSDGLFISN